MVETEQEFTIKLYYDIADSWIRMQVYQTYQLQEVSGQSLNYVI